MDEGSFSAIKLAIDGPVATLTLDRPDRLNAFTAAMADEIVAAFDRTDADPNVRAVIVTGRGAAFARARSWRTGRVPSPTWTRTRCGATPVGWWRSASSTASNP